MADYPFPTTPNSWYGVAWSREVPVGKAVPARYFGRDLVVFRGEDGQARVLDAICPHLGANLGVNGRVQGNSVVCPFHAWRYDGSGACVEIPGSAVIPSRARVGCWPTREVNGAILVWFHADKAPPDYEIPALPMGDTSQWTAPVCRSVDVHTHVQEMNENIFDVAHFVHIHHYQQDGIETEVEEDGPFAHVTLTGRSNLYGLDFPAKTRNSMYGAGFTVIHVVEPIEMAVIVFKTPIDDERVQHRYGVVAPRRVRGLDQLLTRLFAPIVAADVRADSRIWDHKVHLTRPMLVPGDGPIMRFRRWHKQFYSEAAG